MFGRYSASSALRQRDAALNDKTPPTQDSPSRIIELLIEAGEPPDQARQAVRTATIMGSTFHCRGKWYEPINGQLIDPDELLRLLKADGMAAKKAAKTVRDATNSGDWVKVGDVYYLVNPG